MRNQILSLVCVTALGWAAGTVALHFSRPNQETPPPVPTGAETRQAKLSLSNWTAKWEPPTQTAKSMENYRQTMAEFRASKDCGSPRQQIEKTRFLRGLSDDLIRQILREEANPNIPKSDLNRMISNLAKHSPQDAMQFVEDLELENKLSIYDLLAMRGAVHRQWLKQDSDAAVDYALRRTRKDPYALHYLVRDWTSTDPGATMRTVAALPDAPRVSATDIFSHWIEKDRSSAIAWLESESPEPLREQLQSALRQNQHQNPWEKISAATQAVDPFSSKMEQAWIEWFGSDPKAAVAKLNELEKTASAEEAQTSEKRMIAAARRTDFVSDYSESPKEELLKVIDDLNSDSTRDALISRFVESRSRQGEFDVATSVVPELRTQYARNHVLGSIVTRWADRDLESLTSFLATLPSDNARHSAVARLVLKLAPIELESARAWANTIPEDFSSRASVEAALEAAEK